MLGADAACSCVHFGLDATRADGIGGCFCDATRHNAIDADGVNLRLMAVPVIGDEAGIGEGTGARLRNLK
jgi:hypothetical protein